MLFSNDHSNRALRIIRRIRLLQNFSCELFLREIKGRYHSRSDTRKKRWPAFRLPWSVSLGHHRTSDRH